MPAQNVPPKSAPTVARTRPTIPRLPPTPRKAAEPPRAVRILRGEHASTIRLDERARYVLGRHDAADVVFDAPEVSRLHGVLRFVAGRWVYEDYGSQNGSTLLRFEGIRPLPAHAPVALEAGDIIELGGEGARIEMLPEAEALEVAEERGSDVEVSRAARAFAERVRLAARTRVPVFLLGASGAGKTFTARQIHELSALPGPFVPINCARLPQDPTALHSELLGHVKGAYTGAEGPRVGKLVFVDGGTLFLDEVESLPPLAQGFLLDVLEGTGELLPLGAPAGQRLKPMTFRLIAASKAPLSQSSLRPDLCERLAEGHLWRVPGLEERREDVPGLVRRFAAEQEKMLGVPVQLTPAAVRFCAEARWPGQLRQLRATVVALAQLGLARRLAAAAEAGARPGDDRRERAAVVLRDSDFAAHLAEREIAFGPAALGGPLGGSEPLRTKADARALTPSQLRAALAAASGSRAAAARALGISRNTLAKKLAALHLEVE
jgi:DNA-binding NtrC family response regulator